MSAVESLQAVIDCEAQRLGEICKGRGCSIATAESLTAGMIASSIVGVSGSSAYFDRGFVVYNNTAKHELLGVSLETLERFSEVSGECVREMAQGALINSHASLAVSVSGIAGPTGGSAENPVGTVWMGLASRHGECKAQRLHFAGSRQEVRMQTVLAALKALIALAGA